jgi:uncharacterized cupredoxin-like copper-binding protein
MGGSSVSLKSILVGCLGLLFIAALAGCGGGGGTEQSEQGADTVQETTIQENTTIETTSPISTTTEGSTVAESPIDVIQVNETEMSLEPSDITLDRPGTYVFRAVNVGEVVHSLRIEGNGIEEQQTREIGPGESADLTATLEPGTYELDCPVGNHEELGMRGRVPVLEG